MSLGAWKWFLEFHDNLITKLIKSLKSRGPSFNMSISVSKSDSNKYKFLSQVFSLEFSKYGSTNICILDIFHLSNHFFIFSKDTRKFAILHWNIELNHQCYTSRWIIHKDVLEKAVSNMVTLCYSSLENVFAWNECISLENIPYINVHSSECPIGLKIALFPLHI